ncbi:protein of unknown function [Candidatus Promineifilum breve]|uniref:Uncharacterized protein n=1 Tax=Candidatus Promineifilum breve TaxID=1806508 RepID=A0A160T6A9_9CHLR|nr:protein of unknown function [Candidatus Promineifilum breve]
MSLQPLLCVPRVQFTDYNRNRYNAVETEDDHRQQITDREDLFAKATSIVQQRSVVSGLPSVVATTFLE